MTRVTDVEAVMSALDDIDFPASKQEIVQHAEQRGADEDVLKGVRALPLATYHNDDEIRRSLPVEPEMSPSEKATKARNKSHSHVAEHLRQPRD